jgi:hypothetical protein
MTALISQLRSAIDAKHREALQALETVTAYLTKAGYLGDGDIEANEETPRRPRHRRKHAKQPAPRAGTGKYRPGVISATTDQFLTVKQIAVKTGFTSLQIRGVLQAPVFKEKFAKREIDGVMQYKYQDTHNG